MESIRHIEKAKGWLTVVAGVFLLSLAGDVFFALRGEQESWFYRIGLEFRQGEQIIENKRSGADSGIWISGAQDRLMERGEPRWIRNAILLLGFVMIFRHLSKAYAMPEPRKISHENTSSIS